jgi:AAA ATPase domain/AAA domain, putative AbiEii toxin, Type IV TA system
MYIKSVAIENFKSFYAKQMFHFEPGFNLLVGANNSGKTTVLDVIDLDYTLNSPHRSTETIPIYGDLLNSVSSFEIVLHTSFSELRDLAGPTQLYLPIDPWPTTSVDQSDAIQKALELAVSDSQLMMRVLLGNRADATEFNFGSVIKGRASGSHPSASGPVVQFQNVPSETKPRVELVNGHTQQYMGRYYESLRQRIYRFSAKRQPAADCMSVQETSLDRECRSLPFWINSLQTNDADGHAQLCKWVNRIFPGVYWVQAPWIQSGSGGSFQLRCLPCTPAQRRDDLSTSISSMGTGIGNVIAMLYVVLTSRRPQVIAIDEPNAFLHAKALRELLAILSSEGGQHQFILTAHSADVLTAVTAKTISLLDYDGVATVVKQVGPQQLHSIRGELAELGIRMTDLHAKDRVLWVEGQTEELVMPALLRYACPEIAAGMAVLRVERTGTFSKKGMDPREIADIYGRLASSSALVPPMVCILLDGEKRDADARRALETTSKGRLCFLDRRMLENYLLHVDAISAVLSALGVDVTQNDTQEKLKSLSTVPESDLNDVDGAKLLGDLFSSASNATAEFRKTRDVPAIVEWLIDNRPEALAPLSKCLRSKLSLNQKQT